MGTYDTLLLAFDRERRVEEAESLWNMIIHAHTRCVSKRLFSRMIALYDHYDMPEKIIEVSSISLLLCMNVFSSSHFDAFTCI